MFEGWRDAVRGGVIGALVVLATFQGVAWGRPRPGSKNYNAYVRQKTRESIKQTEAQLTAAQNVLAASVAEVGALQAAVTDAQGALETASDAAKTARSEVQSLSQRLREIEAQLDESEPKDSPFAQAKATFQDAKAALEQDQARVFASADYKARLKEATQGDGKSEKVPQLKEQTLKNDLAYQRIKIEFDAAHAAYDREKNALLAKNSEWTETNKLAAAARLEQTKAEQQAQGSAARKASASAKLRDASKVNSAAQANVQQLTASLHSMQAFIGQKPSTPDSEKRPKAKK